MFNAEWFQTHILEMLFGLISAGLLAGFKVLASRLKDAEKKNKAIEEGLQALLRDGVITHYDKYMQRGYILVRELENMQSMYNAYHALGGNGTITRLIEELQELPHSKSIET